LPKENPVLRLIYSSVETCDFSEKDLMRLLLRARLRNAQLGVTGMLVHHNGTFLQALEGGEEAVQAVFDHIARDPRHTNLVVRKEKVAGRLFPQFAMGFRTISQSSQLLKGFVELRSQGMKDSLRTVPTVKFLMEVQRNLPSQ
jgi:hypothetical protein